VARVWKKRLKNQKKEQKNKKNSPGCHKKGVKWGEKINYLKRTDFLHLTDRRVRGGGGQKMQLFEGTETREKKKKKRVWQVKKGTGVEEVGSFTP